MGVMDEGNGLQFMRARFGQVDIGRFTSQDPVGIQGGSTNLYEYAGNSPVVLTDPSGTTISRTQLIMGPWSEDYGRGPVFGPWHTVHFGNPSQPKPKPKPKSFPPPDPIPGPPIPAPLPPFEPLPLPEPGGGPLPGPIVILDPEIPEGYICLYPLNYDLTLPIIVVQTADQ
jgi:RHS repeat-associated protein